MSHYLISFNGEKTLQYKAHNITIITASILAQSALMTYHVCANKVDRQVGQPIVALGPKGYDWTNILWFYAIDWTYEYVYFDHLT